MEVPPACDPLPWLTDIVDSEDLLQRVAVIGHDTAPVYQAHAVDGRSARGGIVYPLSQLPHGGGGGEAWQVDAALHLGRRRQDLEIDGRRLFSHGRSGRVCLGCEVVVRVQRA